MRLQTMLTNPTMSPIINASRKLTKQQQTARAQASRYIDHVWLQTLVLVNVLDDDDPLVAPDIDWDKHRDHIPEICENLGAAQQILPKIKGRGRAIGSPDEDR